MNGDLPQLEPIDPTFRKWRIENACVKRWLIDPSLISNFIRFSTAKQVWESIATTNTSQVYHLKRRVTRMKQIGGSIESYYNSLQGLWRETDFCCPNPMECADDVYKYNSSLTGRQNLYILSWFGGQTRQDLD